MLRAFYQRGDCMGVTLKQRSCDEVWGIEVLGLSTLLKLGAYCSV